MRDHMGAASLCMNGTYASTIVSAAAKLAAYEDTGLTPEECTELAMEKKYNPSKPFSNGSEYMLFNESFCCECAKYKVDDDGMPLTGNCKIEEAFSVYQLTESGWPERDIVQDGDMKHICLRFERICKNG